MPSDARPSRSVGSRFSARGGGWHRSRTCSSDAILRAGIIGVDTSHAVEFTKILNAANPAADVAGVRVVAAFPGGSDVPESRRRRGKFIEEVKAMNVELVDSIPALLKKVDVVLLESVMCRRYSWSRFGRVMKVGKPVFI